MSLAALREAISAAIPLDAETVDLATSTRIDQAREAAGLGVWDCDDARAMGEAIGEALADRSIVALDALLWGQLAQVHYPYLSDFEEVAFMPLLEAICGGALRALAETRPADRHRRTRRDCIELAAVWTTRLTGNAYLYDYVTRQEIVDFARSCLLEVPAPLDGDAPEVAWNELANQVADRVSGTLFRLKPSELGPPPER